MRKSGVKAAGGTGAGLVVQVILDCGASSPGYRAGEGRELHRSLRRPFLCGWSSEARCAARQLSCGCARLLRCYSLTGLWQRPQSCKGQPCRRPGWHCCPGWLQESQLAAVWLTRVLHICLGWLVLWESRVLVLACTQEDIRGRFPKAGAKVANGWMIASRSHKAGCGHEALCVRLVRSERGWM